MAAATVVVAVVAWWSTRTVAADGYGHRCGGHRHDRSQYAFGSRTRPVEAQEGTSAAGFAVVVKAAAWWDTHFCSGVGSMGRTVRAFSRSTSVLSMAGLA